MVVMAVMAVMGVVVKACHREPQEVFVWDQVYPSGEAGRNQTT